MSVPAADQSPQPGSGGQGELAIGVSRGDAVLLARARKGRWKIPPVVFEKLPKRLAQRALSKGARLRDANATARVLVQMNAQNADESIGGGEVVIRVERTDDFFGPTVVAEAIEPPASDPSIGGEV